MDGSAKMHEYISGFASHLKTGYAIGKKAYLPQGNFASLIICGMGGSAIGGDLLLGLARTFMKIPAFVNRTYTLPEWVNEDTLAIFSSYSGGTGETLSCFNEAQKRKCTGLSVTTGGKLADLSKEASIPCVKIPGGLPPRAALGYSFAPLLKIFARMGFVDSVDDDFREAVSLIEKCTPEFAESSSSPAKLAGKLKGKIPVFYTDGFRLEAVGTRFRCQLNENAKTLAFCNVFPELNHNEIVGWGIPGFTIDDLAPVFIIDVDSRPEVILQMETTLKILKNAKIECHVIESVGDSFLERMLYLVHFADWLSWHLAKLNNVDPMPIERINLLKEELSKKM